MHHSVGHAVTCQCTRFTALASMALALFIKGIYSSDVNCVRVTRTHLDSDSAITIMAHNSVGSSSNILQLTQDLLRFLYYYLIPSLIRMLKPLLILSLATLINSFLLALCFFIPICLTQSIGNTTSLQNASCASVAC